MRRHSNRRNLVFFDWLLFKKRAFSSFCSAMTYVAVGKNDEIDFAPEQFFGANSSNALNRSRSCDECPALKRAAISMSLCDLKWPEFAEPNK